MRYVVTGATGFIGAEFVKLALELGHEVVAVCRPNSTHLDRLPADSDLTMVQLPMSDYQSLPLYIDHADAFVHFAWDGTSREGRTQTDVQQHNVCYSEEAIEAASRMGCRLFAGIGSQAEYGVTHGPTDVDTPCQPFSEYGKAKLMFKESAFHLCERLGIQYLHLRVFSIFGENDHPHTLLVNALGRMLRNEALELSSCVQNWNFLYVRDAVKQILLLTEKAYGDRSLRHEVFHVASAHTHPLSYFLERMKVLLHSDSPLNYGAYTPEHAVELNPVISKTQAYIGYTESYTFDEAILLTANRIMENQTHSTATSASDTRRCLVCGAPLDTAHPLFVCDNMPGSAQDIPSADELQQDHGIQLSLVQCRQCGLVQIPTEPVHYYKKVIRAGGGTTTMVNLRREQYAELLDRFDLKGKKILEVGCGKGEFLRIWKDFDVRAVGIEFDAELVRRARSEGLEVYKAYADHAHTHLPEAPFDAFVQFNFLEHQPYPNEMLQCIYNNLTDDVVGLVTVPSLEYILQYDGYYELIKDHIAYYTKDTLSFLFQKNGFEVIDCHTVNRDTHAITVRKRRPTDVSSWKANFENLQSELHSYVDSYAAKGEKVAVWGASHQGFTLIPSLGLSDKIAYIIDSAPFKQGKFAPASHVPIVDRAHFFDEPVASILIVAPGYTDEIAHIIRTELSSDIDIRTLRSNHLEKLT